MKSTQKINNKDREIKKIIKNNKIKNKWWNKILQLQTKNKKIHY